MAYFEAICVHGHTLLVDCESDRGQQIQKLADEEIECVDAVPAEECVVCVSTANAQINIDLLNAQEA